MVSGFLLPLSLPWSLQIYAVLASFIIRIYKLFFFVQFDKPELNGSSSSSNYSMGESSRESSATGSSSNNVHNQPQSGQHGTPLKTSRAEDDAEEENFDLKKTQLVKASQVCIVCS